MAIEKINATDTLNAGREKINQAIDAIVNSSGNIVNVGFTESFDTLNALKTEYPNGASGMFFVFDNGSGNGGHSYMWINGAWKDGGVYQATEIADQSITEMKTTFFDLPHNFWTNGDVIVTGTGTWKNKTIDVNLPPGTYTLYVHKASGYEPSVERIVEITTYKTSDNTKLLTKTITKESKFGTFTVEDGQYAKMTFFLSRETSIVEGRAEFRGIYLLEGSSIDPLLNAKIKKEKIDSSIITDYISSGGSDLMSNQTIVVTRTNPEPYSLTKFTLDVQPQKEYILNIGTYTGTQSSVIAIMELQTNDGTVISQTQVTGNITNILTTENTKRIRIYFYLTFETGATGELTATFTNVNFYSKGNLNEKVQVTSENLSGELLRQIENTKSDDFFLYLPDRFDVAKGSVLEIYNKQVCHCGNIDNYHFNWKCSVGSAYARKLTIDSTNLNAGSYTATLYIYDNNLNLIKTASTVINVIAKPSDNTVKTVLPIGDSLTDIDKWRKELKLLADTMFGTSKINYIGTKGPDPLYKHEGMSGWKTTHFLANGDYTYGGNIILTVSGVTEVPVSKKQYNIPDSSGSHVWEFEKAVGNDYYFNRITNGSYTINTMGTITEVESSTTGDTSITYTAWKWQPGNPFWNTTTNQLDFNDYLTRNGFTQPNYVTIFLGTNNLSNANGKYSELKTGYNQTVADLKTIVDKILSQWTTTKILVILPPYFAGQDGYKNADRFELQQHLRVYTLTEMINSQFKSYNTDVKVVPIAQTMDSDYVFGRVENPVNPRMTNVTVPMPVEVTHPRDEGFYQMADTIFGSWLAQE